MHSGQKKYLGLFCSRKFDYSVDLKRRGDLVYTVSSLRGSSRNNYNQVPRAYFSANYTMPGVNVCHLSSHLNRIQRSFTPLVN